MLAVHQDCQQSLRKEIQTQSCPEKGKPPLHQRGTGTRESEALNAFRNATSLRFNESITEDAFYNYAKLSYEIGNPFETTSSVLNKYVSSYPDGPHAKEISDLLISSFIQEKTYYIILVKCQTTISFPVTKVL